MYLVTDMCGVHWGSTSGSSRNSGHIMVRLWTTL